MKKGFTLIELLAVIVILAIIALIATPIVLNIINETKESANLRSAEMYLDGVEQSIARSMLKNKYIEDGTYNILDDGNICLEKYELENDKYVCKDNDGVLNNNELIVEVDGEKPSGGNIDIKNGNIENILIELNDNKMVKNDKGEVIMHPCTLVEDADSNNTITPGDKYECKVEPNKDAYTFYVLSDGENGTTNLIMDKNICSDGTEATASNTCLVAWYADSWNNSYGPETAMNYLDIATSTWINIENFNTSYDDEYGYFSNFPITGKARLPYLSEVNEICAPEEDGTKNCLNQIGGPIGFWLFDSDINDTFTVSGFGSDGNVGCYNAPEASLGVRPVINVRL